MYTVIQSKYLISIYLQMALQFANDPQLWAKYVFQKYILIPQLESDFLFYSNACVMELTQFCSDLPGAC